MEPTELNQWSRKDTRETKWSQTQNETVLNGSQNGACAPHLAPLAPHGSKLKSVCIGTYRLPVMETSATVKAWSRMHWFTNLTLLCVSNLISLLNFYHWHGRICVKVTNDSPSQRSLTRPLCEIKPDFVLHVKLHVHCKALHIMPSKIP